VEGRNLTLEFRWAEGKYERLPELAAELVRLNVDVIVTHGTPGTSAAKKVTSTVPIVISIAGDAVATGLVASLARPGGNITGSTYFTPELHAKRLDFLKEAMPRMTRAAFLFNPGNPSAATDPAELVKVAQSLKVNLQQFGVRGPAEFDTAFAAMVKARTEGVVIHDDAMLLSNAGLVAGLAAEKRIPAIGSGELVDLGGMMAYGIDFVEATRYAATIVDKILKGTKPGDIPIERATKFELTLNMKAAKALGVSFPQAILVRANRVIE